jgi:hypothetical protein
MSTELIQHQRLTAIISQYESAQREVRRAFDLMISAKHRLESVFGDGHNYYHHIFDGQINDFALGDDAKRAEQRIRRNGWSYIAKLTELHRYMSVATAKKFGEQIEKGDLPELTEKNVYDMLTYNAQRIPELTTEAIKEAFRILRPARSTYKTNKKYEIGKKVILSRWIKADQFGVSVNYYCSDEMRSLDNAFALLDGAGVPKYPNNLECIIQDAMTRREWQAETPYFKLKWYKAGTLHLEFKRLDLLEKLNAIGGEGMLKGE